MSYFPKPSLNENDLAIIERGATAAHSIDAGQYVTWHGKTGKAKAAILQGATLSDSLFDYDEDGALNTSLVYCVEYTGTTPNIESHGSYINRFSSLGLVLPTGYHVIAFSGWITGESSTLGRITGQGIQGSVDEADLGFIVYNSSSVTKSWTYKIRLLIGKMP